MQRLPKGVHSQVIHVRSSFPAPSVISGSNFLICAFRYTSAAPSPPLAAHVCVCVRESTRGSTRRRVSKGWWTNERTDERVAGWVSRCGESLHTTTLQHHHRLQGLPPPPPTPSDGSVSFVSRHTTRSTLRLPPRHLKSEPKLRQTKTRTGRVARTHCNLS